MASLPARAFRVGILMVCGCAAPGTLQRPGEPALVGCGLHDCTEVADAPDLSQRLARCMCGKTAPSSTALAFFELHLNAPHDRFYCGCRGWN